MGGHIKISNYMIAGYFHQGSGLGDQLFRYITTRTLALDKGYDFGMIYNPDGSGKEAGFKGGSFMEIDYGKTQFEGNFTSWEEKCVRDEKGNDVRSYDPEINFVEDNTIIDGCFEDDKYWGHRIPEIREWLKVEPLEMPDDLCVIGFRGGEYATNPELFLTKEYFDSAMKIMHDINPKMRFEVHTDDEATARACFPMFPVTHNIGLNWRSVRHAKYLIIPNSAFFIMPSLIGDAKKIIAPRYWARRNTRVWARPACYYKKFTYI